MLTGIIVACLLYVLLFAALWSRARVVVTPYGKHVHLTAPSDSEAAEAFLRADLELAREGR